VGIGPKPPLSPFPPSVGAAPRQKGLFVFPARHQLKKKNKKKNKKAGKYHSKKITAKSQPPPRPPPKKNPKRGKKQKPPPGGVDPDFPLSLPPPPGTGKTDPCENPALQNLNFFFFVLKIQPAGGFFFFFLSPPPAVAFFFREMVFSAPLFFPSPFPQQKEKSHLGNGLGFLFG